ncbi:Uncharacterised protein [Pseudomonas aeruginosa]|nr:Uncharacterised protein [Pseudomonas aeruginosa]
MAADTHALAQFRRPGEHPGAPADAALAQALAEVLVEIQQAGFVAEALAIGRVADHQAGLALVRARLESRQFALVDLHPVGHSGTLDIVARRLDQARIGLVAANPQRRPGQAGRRALLGFLVELAPQRRHVPQPIAEAPALAPEVRRDIGSHQRRLDQEGADAAHRVGQGTALGGDLRPAGTDQHRRRQVLLQRRGALLQTIAALVQAMPGEVQGEGRLAAVKVQVDAHVRIDLVHRRASAGALAQVVDDRILDLQRPEMSVVDARALAAELHRQRAAGVQVVFPVHRVDRHVHGLGVLHRESRQHQQDPVGQARPQAEAIGHLQAALSAHRRHLGARLVQAEPLRLFEEQAFQAFRAGQKQFVNISHIAFPGRSPCQWKHPHGHFFGTRCRGSIAGTLPALLAATPSRSLGDPSSECEEISIGGGTNRYKAQPRDPAALAPETRRHEPATYGPIDESVKSL